MAEFFQNFFADNAGAIVVRIVCALLVLVIGWLLVKWLIRLIFRGKLKEKMEPGAFTFVRSMVSILLKVVLIMIAAGIMGIPTASLVALIGSAGLAIGLALQGSLSNLAGGIMILTFKPFKVGDYIEPANADSGTVKEISILYTTLVTPNNQTVVIPNGELSNKPVKNFYHMDTRRLSMNFNVSYHSDVDLVKKIILQVVESVETVKPAPAPYVRLRDLAEYALIFEMRAWSDTDDYWRTWSAINEGVKAAFDAAGIEIPFPQMVVHEADAPKPAAKKQLELDGEEAPALTEQAPLAAGEEQ